MPFKPGISGNPNGKPAGAKNKLSKPLSEKITSFLEENLEVLFKDFHKKTEKQQENIVFGLLPYVLPKKQAITTDIEFERLTDEQLNEIVLKLKKYALQEQELHEN